MKIRRYEFILLLFIFGPFLLTFLLGFLATQLAAKGTDGTEYLPAVFVEFLVFPVALIIGTITALVTRKSPKHEQYTLIGYGLISVPAMLFITISYATMAISSLV